MLKSSASERNKEPILNVLKTCVSDKAPMKALEIASGCGTHVVHFASHYKNIDWQPTDVDERCLCSIKHYINSFGLRNVRKPLVVDVSEPIEKWPQEVVQNSYDLIICINMMHISPFICSEGLFAAAGRLLKIDGQLVTYGPYAVNGVLTPQSNVEFDRSLRESNAEWGVRDVSVLQEVALKNSLRLINTFEMPANNKTLIFKKSAT